ncbi:putative helicase MOV-10, partial [Sitodiplosis mosellana]|uniref:putative helicase MOV-10 n=1 Tax=Sitodiplosis mosellana TaxID=263140 RepID=UPI002443DE14
LCSEKNRINANIILAGDPKQLDAVCKSNNAAGLGLKTSLMERLYNLPAYGNGQVHQPQSGTMNNNSDCITQLIKNYRSHKAILHVANALFYKSTLISCGSDERVNWFVGSKILMNPDVPIIFKSVNGVCKQNENSASRFNMVEANAVLEQIDELLKFKSNQRKVKSVKCTDIGIVSPYKLQCREIRKMCNKKKYDGITIGTAEVFQGMEKAIMLVSTVCTDGDLGFVNAAQRINVVLTRAQSLLIIFGDPKTLIKDPNWEYLLQFCELNETFKHIEGKPFQFPKPVVQESVVYDFKYNMLQHFAGLMASNGDGIKQHQIPSDPTESYTLDRIGETGRNSVTLSKATTGDYRRPSAFMFTYCQLF